VNGYADEWTLAVLGNHLGRHHGFAPTFVRIERGQNGAFVMTTVLVERER
jgi:hypothetical protein